MPMVQGQLHLERMELLLAMYRKLVYWPKVLMKTHDGRLTFIWHAICNTNASHVLVYQYTPVYSLNTLCVPIFAN